MKVLLTHGYYLFEDLKEQKIMKPYVPLGILYLSAFLDQKNVIHDVYDTTFSSQEKHFKYLQDKKFDIIAVYTNLMTKIKVIELINSSLR